MKYCPCCGLSKPDDAFYKNAAKKGGLQGYCKPCHGSQVKKSPFYKANINKFSLNYQRKKVGWSPERFDKAWQDQNGKCAICEVALNRDIGVNKMSACADHDHTTLEPRGILCNVCNRQLGSFEKMAKLGAQSYLDKYTQ